MPQSPRRQESVEEQEAASGEETALYLWVNLKAASCPSIIMISYQVEQGYQLYKPFFQKWKFET